MSRPAADGRFAGSRLSLSAGRSPSRPVPRLRLAVEHAPEGLAVTDVAGRFTMVNPVLARLVGWSEAELLAKRLAELVHPDDRTAHERCIGRVVRGEIPAGDVDERFVARSGGVVWVRLLVGMARDDDGHARQLVLQVSDVHRFKEREQDLERQALLDPLTGVGEPAPPRGAPEPGAG